MKPKILYIVIPCYNEQEVLSETAKRIRNKMTALIDAGQISMNSLLMMDLEIQHGKSSQSFTMRTSCFMVSI